ncbi:MAG: hypothetical protein HY744_15180 [Deltaproteobacteria bacterium]|nr:hypothetical protein [Deltaproteobacteria bacterium]
MARPMRLLLAQGLLGALASLGAGALTLHCSGEDSTLGGLPHSGAGGSATASSSGAAGSGGTLAFDAGEPEDHSIDQFYEDDHLPAGSGGTLAFDAGEPEDHSIDQFYEDDPLPTTCDGGGQPPPHPGGTPECPGDKNLQGCPCQKEGENAACWPGKRKNRNRGICKDGTTVCKLLDENKLGWGPCAGAVLPVPGATKGKEACLCFSGGHWELDNLVPCFFTSNGKTVAVSTVLVGNYPQYPPNADAPPAQPWSPNRLTVDCTGFFKLCYTIKAGDGKSPKPADCVVASVCTEQHYAPANAVVEFPPLPSWLSTPAQSACVQQFMSGGGYGEMSVVGESDECDKVDKVFQTVTYCPLACSNPNPPPECANCQPGGGGSF